jgi:hypothetical protein
VLFLFGPARKSRSRKRDVAVQRWPWPERPRRLLDGQALLQKQVITGLWSSGFGIQPKHGMPLTVMSLEHLVHEQWRATNSAAWFVKVFAPALTFE